ncbi:MAG: hypothetical protein ACYC09_09745 [Bacteroidota bacterium]
MINIIGIAGTAKNTGKTTTLNALLAVSSGRGAAIGITGIGYDGEDIDNITGLPKPRVIVHEGMIVSTSRLCIPASGWTIIERTPYTSALGEIVIARCDKQSTVVIAGPKKGSDLLNVTRRMSDAGCTTIFVDGALNRIAPMSTVDKIIFTTGAARTIDIASLVSETKAIERIFHLPGAPHRSRNDSPSSIIHTVDDVEKAARSGTNGTELVLRGLISNAGLNALIHVLSNTKKNKFSSVIFDNPIPLLLSGEPEKTMRSIDTLQSMQIGIFFARTIALPAFTVNPFYPEYSGTTYAMKFVDSLSLLSLMESTLTTPVFNIKATGAERLWNELQK